jgi:uncharacterized protein (DUF1778 family)
MATRKLTPVATPSTQMDLDELVNVSVRLYAVHKQMVEQAAALVPNRTPSDYIREVLSYQAALDLNVELPPVPEVTRGRGGSLISQAAAKLGLSRQEFEAQAARAFAAQTLGADALENRPETARPLTGPGTGLGVFQARPASGSYTRTDLPSERPMSTSRAASPTRTRS